MHCLKSFFFLQYNRKNIISYLIGNVVGKPVQTFVKALPRGCTGALNVPGKPYVS